MNIGQGPGFRDRLVSDEIFAVGMALTPQDHEGVDGVIVNAVITDWYGDKTQQVAYGNVFGDKKGRFSEGYYIHTSKILEGPDENGLLKTRFSTYRLKMKPEIEIADVTGTSPA